MKYLEYYDLEKLTSIELLEYRKKLAKKAVELKQDISNFGSAWDSINSELRTRLDDLQYNVLELEVIRETAATQDDWNELSLH